MSEAAIATPAVEAAPAAPVATEPAVTPAAPSDTKSAPTSEAPKTDAKPAQPPKRTSGESLMDEFLAMKKAAKANEAPATPGEEPKAVAEAAAPEAKAEVQPEATTDDKELEPEAPVANRPSLAKVPVENLDRDYLKHIPDENVRREVRRRMLRARAYDELYTIPEAKARKELHPTIDAAKEDREIAQWTDQLRGAYLSGNEQGIQHFTQNLWEASPEAFQTFAGHLANHLENVNPQAYYQIVANSFDSIFQDMRARAARGESFNGLPAEHLKDAVDVLSIYLGWANGDGEPIQDTPAQVDPNDPAMRRLQELEQREAERAAADRRNFHGHVKTQFANGLKSEITAAIEAVDPDGLYPESIRKRMTTEISQKLLATMSANPTVQRQTSNLMTNGGMDAAHAQRVVQHLTSNARGLLPLVAKSVLQEYADLFRTAQGKRQAQQAQVESRKDLGSAGTATAFAAAPLPPNARPDDVLDWFAKNAPKRAGRR